MVVRSEVYNGDDGECVEHSEGSDDGDCSVPRTIARYDDLKKDNAFDCPGTGCITYGPYP